ncbi:MAG TPA: TerC/Alx family metal homeostasis membrane protein [Thermoleophilaceae bacterium]|nr:TerC/Alx family metal homeostasis membrane protein [Thermoleophilaceae bacterium]
MEHSALAWLALAAALVVFLWLDLKLFARGREPRFREAAIWSLAWVGVALAAALVLWLLAGRENAVIYTTVYVIERSLSLDNLVVFLMLFAYFAVASEHRARLLFWGIAAALVLRGLAILGGVALIREFEVLLYALAVALLWLAYRMFRGVEESIDPERNPLVRLVRRVYPVTTTDRRGRWFVRVDGRWHTTPAFLCLVAIVFADLAFAIDSIPAAFAITRDAYLIWMGNVFALIGLRALFVLVDGLVRRFRYLDETVAVVLAFVAVKLLIEGFVHIPPLPSLGIVAALFAAGIVASLLADRGDPDAASARADRAERMRGGGEASAEAEGTASGRVHEPTGSSRV